VTGGGVLGTPHRPTENVTASFPPNHREWEVALDNTGSAAHEVTVYAICVDPPLGYAVVGNGPISTLAHSHTGASVHCPGRTTELGGGVEVNTGLIGFHLESSFPQGDNRWDQWLGQVNNTTVNAARKLTP
jgi:hypothetical protein